MSTDSDSVVIPRIAEYINQSYQWWRLTVDDATNPDGYIQIGRMVGCDYYEPSREVTTSFRLSRHDPSVIQAAPGESPVVKQEKKKAKFRRLTMAFETMDDTQRKQLEAIFEKVGMSEPLIVDVDSDNAPDKLMYGYNKTDLDLMHESIQTYWSALGIVVEEVTR